MIIDRLYLENVNGCVKIEDEVWKPITGYEGILEVSNWGNIKRVSGKTEYFRGNTKVVRSLPEMKYSVQKGEEGYLYIMALGSKYFSCHRTVAIEFIPCNLDTSSLEVDHIDNNPSNPYYKNLQWVTQEKNRKKSYENVLESNGRKIYSIPEMVLYPSVKSLANNFGKNSYAVLQSIHYGIKNFGGYVPKYDILVKYEDEIDIDNFNGEYEILCARRNFLRTIKRPGVRCINTGKIYPNAINASKSLGLPNACVSEALNEYNGFYKKKNLKFEYVALGSLDDYELDSIMDYFIDYFSKRSGGRYNSK